MLRIVVYDCGYGGDIFAERLGETLPAAEIIRVIDWRHAREIQSSPRRARERAKASLLPYIGKVDLIVFTNYLLSITSLKYFQRKYTKQQFIGYSLKTPDSYVKRDVLILTTKPLARTFVYRNYLFHIGRRTRTLALDNWPAKIDDGILTSEDISSDLATITASSRFKPEEVVLACSQFSDIKPELRHVLGRNLKIYDSLDDTLYRAYKVLKIRGGIRRKTK